MAETGNSILDVTTIADIQSRLAAIESALGKTNAVNPLIGAAEVAASGFLINGQELDRGVTSAGYQVGQVKIYVNTYNLTETTNFKPGTAIRFPITIQEFASAKNVWVSATPRLTTADTAVFTNQADINISCGVRKLAGGPDRFSIFVDSAAAADVPAFKLYVDFIAIGIF